MMLQSKGWLLRITQTQVVVTAVLIALLMFGCGKPESTNQPVDAAYLHNVNIALEQDIVHDFFSPPVAARIYLYPNLVAYEIASQKDSTYHSFGNLIDGFPEIPVYEGDQHELASLYAFLMVAREMVYTTNHVDSTEKVLDSLFAHHKRLSSTKAYARKAADEMLKWAGKDYYKETRNMGDYQPLGEVGTWVPTPPDYLDALEPNWEYIRPVTLDSAAQFAPPPPTPYDMTEGSPYYNELMEVYNVVKHRTDTTESMAKFWDCNPIVSRHEGHFMFSVKKLTPGGHWMNICRMVAIKENLGFTETAYANSMLSVGLFDAFISCWQAKYATHYIRPVTVIQNQIDPNWMPLLITPNFPEYTSGHSVVSRSASTVLTEVFGDGYAFTDSTEVPYGMPPRSFTSFHNASDEAAISRLYGGIHYRPAIDNGLTQGSKVGHHVVNTLKGLKK